MFGGRFVLLCLKKMADRYQIEEQIGEGGEGSVYKAYDKVLKRHVALKRVLTKDRGTSEEVDRAATALVAEAQTLSALNHPNIVTVFDVGKDEEGGFVVMELIKGETLEATVKRGVLTESDFCSLAVQTMEALMAAQEINVVHRDLKPGNVMLVWHRGGRFQAKILDFGLAKFSEVPSLQTLGFDDSVKGSIYFMAPEQFERAELDERTDIYAMGCVYYFALTGVYPFGGESMTMVMVSHLQHQVVSLEKLRPDLSPALCQWVMWMINREVDTRPENAETALQHLPQNLSPIEQQGLQDLPLNKTRSGLTSGVQVVLPTHSAEAPTGMVALADEVESSPVVEPFDAERYAEEYPDERPPPKRKWLGKVIFLGLLGAGLWYFASPMLTDVDVDVQGELPPSRLEELAGKKNPQGTAEDVNAMVAVWISGEATSLQKKQAQRTLEVLQGNDVDAAIFSKLKAAKKSPQRVWLSQIVGVRDADGAVAAMTAAFRAEKNDPERLEILNLLRSLVSVENVKPALDSLKASHSPLIRLSLEQIIVAAFRRIPATEENLASLTGRLVQASGEERRSLWRILGMRGGKVVEQRLGKVFLREKHDKEFRLDAMGALRMLETPRIVNLLNTIYSTTLDNELKAATADALAHAVRFPSEDRQDVRQFWWQLALKIVIEPRDLQQVFTSISDYTDPRVITFLQGVGNSRTFAAYSKAALAKIEHTVREAPVFESNQLLPVSSQTMRADGATFDPSSQTFTRWMQTEAWFVWHFKLKEAGEYEVEVLQSMANNGKSQFSVIIGKAILQGTAVNTGAWDKYQPNLLAGSVRLESGRAYALFLKAGEITQPQMMNIKGIRLHKK